MVDEAQAVVSAPVEVSAPISDTVVTESASSAPVADIPVVEVAPVVAEPEPAAFLATDPKADEKPADAPKTEEKTETKAADEAKPVEDVKPAGEIAPVTYEAFKLPDVYKDNSDAIETVGKFSEILGKFETSPKTHEDFQKFGQDATDFYINGVQNALAKQAEIIAHQHQEKVASRLESLRNDPQLGGKNYDKNKASAIEAIQEYGGNKQQVMQVREDLLESGMEVSPSLVRLITNMKNKLDEYTKEPVSSNLTGTKPDVQKRGLIATLYNS